MIELIVNGNPYTDFTQASVTLSIESLANEFSFTASAVNLFPPFKTGDSIEVWVNRIKRLTGYIEEVNGQEAEGAHTVTYTGRDRTNDFIDSQVVKFDDLRAGDTLTLKTIIETIIRNINTDISVIDLYNPEVFNEAEDIVDAEDGTGAFQLAMEYARKRQALLTSDSDGNINIIQSSPLDSGGILQRVKDGIDNNIVSQSWSVEDSKLYNTYIHKGQLDPRGLNFISNPDTSTIENQDGRITNSEVREGRQRVVIEGKGYSSEQLQNRAIWSSQLDKARATRFNCSVKDHIDFDVNTLVQINSDVADITRKMLINTITYVEGEGQPTLTNLEFVERDVYTINQRILSSKLVGKQNDSFKQALGIQ